MTDLLLAYIAVAFTLYAAREWRSAAAFRKYTSEVHTDSLEAQLLGLEELLVGQVQDKKGGALDGRDLLVARVERQDQQPDSNGHDDSMQGVLHGRIVAARSDG